MDQISDDGQKVIFGPSWPWIILQAGASTAVGVGTAFLVRTQMPDFSPQLMPFIATILGVLTLRLFDRPVLTIELPSGTTTLASGWVPLFRKRVVFQRSALSDVLVEKTGSDEGNPNRIVLLSASGQGHALASGQDLQMQMLATKIRNAIFRA